MIAQSNTPAQEIEELEYLNDLLTLQLARLETANDELIPASVVNRLSTGESPLRVWREHRKLEIAALAERARVPARAIAEIEGGRVEGPLRIFVALAEALSIDAEDLLPWPQEDDARP